MTATSPVPVVPRPAATVMLLRDAPDLEVLLLRRASTTPFVPGAHVFPGGALESSDAAVSVHGGLDDLAASAVLEVERHGLAFWFAAVRECLEEAGVLLATDASGRWVDSAHPAFGGLAALRQAVEDGHTDLASHCAGHGVQLAADRVAYVSRWITPEVSPRRYDTRFFAAPMPEGQVAEPDSWEAVDARWWAPADALEDWQAGVIDLIEPTVCSLRLLTGFGSTADALDAFHAGARRPERVLEPEGGVRIALPSDLAGDHR